MKKRLTLAKICLNRRRKTSSIIMDMDLKKSLKKILRRKRRAINMSNKCSINRTLLVCKSTAVRKRQQNHYSVVESVVEFVVDLVALDRPKSSLFKTKVRRKAVKLRKRSLQCPHSVSPFRINSKVSLI